VPGGGVADEWGPSGSGRVREEGALTGGTACRRAWAAERSRPARGAPRKEKVGRAQMNSRISDLFKLILNKFKLI
jgi:hypothetical protein